ncbi:MAG: hypothetical protein JXC85_04090 [Candidatus Aenigmarchaeota archaeon]|nr:hypothetical protein [Candidatus Aenigmarchaeota archaeon]
MSTFRISPNKADPADDADPLPLPCFHYFVIESGGDKNKSGFQGIILFAISTYAVSCVVLNGFFLGWMQKLKKFQAN